MEVNEGDMKLGESHYKNVISNPNFHFTEYDESTLKLPTADSDPDQNLYTTEPCQCSVKPAGSRWCDQLCPTRALDAVCSERCGTGCLNRVESAVTTRYDLLEIRRYEDRRGYAVFSRKFIPAKTYLAPYVGKVISGRNHQFLCRSKGKTLEYSAQLLYGHRCRFIVAEKVGGIARYFNNSCDGGNVELVAVNTGKDYQLVLRTTQDVKASTELTYLYDEKMRIGYPRPGLPGYKIEACLCLPHRKLRVEEAKKAGKVLTINFDPLKPEIPLKPPQRFSSNNYPTPQEHEKDVESELNTRHTDVNKENVTEEEFSKESKQPEASPKRESPVISSLSGNLDLINQMDSEIILQEPQQSFDSFKTPVTEEPKLGSTHSFKKHESKEGIYDWAKIVNATFDEVEETSMASSEVTPPRPEVTPPRPDFSPVRAASPRTFQSWIEADLKIPNVCDSKDLGPPRSFDNIEPVPTSLEDQQITEGDDDEVVTTETDVPLDQQSIISEAGTEPEKDKAAFMEFQDSRGSVSSLGEKLQSARRDSFDFDPVTHKSILVTEEPADSLSVEVNTTDQNIISESLTTEKQDFPQKPAEQQQPLTLEPETSEAKLVVPPAESGNAAAEAQLELEAEETRDFPVSESAKLTAQPDEGSDAQFAEQAQVSELAPLSQPPSAQPEALITADETSYLEPIMAIGMPNVKGDISTQEPESIIPDSPADEMPSELHEAEQVEQQQLDSISTTSISEQDNSLQVQVPEPGLEANETNDNENENTTTSADQDQEKQEVAEKVPTIPKVQESPVEPQEPTTSSSVETSYSSRSQPEPPTAQTATTSTHEQSYENVTPSGVLGRGKRGRDVELVELPQIKRPRLTTNQILEKEAKAANRASEAKVDRHGRPMHTLGNVCEWTKMVYRALTLHPNLRERLEGLSPRVVGQKRVDSRRKLKPAIDRIMALKGVVTSGVSTKKGFYLHDPKKPNQKEVKFCFGCEYFFIEQATSWHDVKDPTRKVKVAVLTDSKERNTLDVPNCYEFHEYARSVLTEEEKCPLHLNGVVTDGKCDLDEPTKDDTSSSD